MGIPYYSIYNYDTNIIKYRAIQVNYSVNNDNINDNIINDSYTNNIMAFAIDSNSNSDSDNENNMYINNNEPLEINSLSHIVDIHNNIKHISFSEEVQYLLGSIASIVILCNMIYKIFTLKNKNKQ
jgi:hypothetical protein